MSREDIVYACNEWMRRYTDEPEKFEREFQTVQRFLAEEDAGQDPSYGNTCWAYMQLLVAERS